MPHLQKSMPFVKKLAFSWIPPNFLWIPPRTQIPHLLSVATAYACVEFFGTDWTLNFHVIWLVYCYLHYFFVYILKHYFFVYILKIWNRRIGARRLLASGARRLHRLPCKRFNYLKIAWKYFQLRVLVHYTAATQIVLAHRVVNATQVFTTVVLCRVNIQHIFVNRGGPLYMYPFLHCGSNPFFHRVL